MNGLVQSLASMIMATRAESGVSGTLMLIFISGGTEGRSRMSRKTPDRGF
jgi:hypothetical protein